MAGSYKHCVDDKGNLLSNDEMMITGAMIENLGDAYEAIEEMYGMIWYLADNLSLFDGHSLAESIDSRRSETIKRLIENAQDHYKRGLEIAKEVNKS